MKPVFHTRGRLARRAQLTAGYRYTVNTYSKPPLYYTLGAVAPLLQCRAYARLPTCCARHNTRAWRPSAACGQTRDARQTRLTNQPTNQPTGQQPFCQYPAVSWELTECALTMLINGHISDIYYFMWFEWQTWHHKRPHSFDYGSQINNVFCFFCRATHVVLARYCYRKSPVRPSVCP